MYDTKLMPMKLRMFQLLGESDKAMTQDDFLKVLKLEYGKESQCTRDRISTYLIAMMATGMIAETAVNYNEKGELTISYVMTELGKSRMKYLPDNHNETAYISN